MNGSLVVQLLRVENSFLHHDRLKHRRGRLASATAGARKLQAPSTFSRSLPGRAEASEKALLAVKALAVAAAGRSDRESSVSSWRDRSRPRRPASASAIKLPIPRRGHHRNSGVPQPPAHSRAAPPPCATQLGGATSSIGIFDACGCARRENAACTSHRGGAGETREAGCRYRSVWRCCRRCRRARSGRRRRSRRAQRREPVANLLRSDVETMREVDVVARLLGGRKEGVVRHQQGGGECSPARPARVTGSGVGVLLRALNDALDGRRGDDPPDLVSDVEAARPRRISEMAGCGARDRRPARSARMQARDDLNPPLFPGGGARVRKRLRSTCAVFANSSAAVSISESS